MNTWKYKQFIGSDEPLEIKEKVNLLTRNLDVLEVIITSEAFTKPSQFNKNKTWYYYRYKLADTK